MLIFLSAGDAYSQNLHSIKVIFCNFATVKDFVSTVYIPPTTGYHSVRIFMLSK